jgi:uncharacterized caspase-like protein
MSSFTPGRALVIGVGAYDDERWDVPTATRDAAELHALLIDPARGGYDAGKAELLVDARATREEIVRALRRLADRCDEQSIALISLTCHGAMGDDGLYYLASSDARFTRDGIAAGTGLSVRTLAAALRDISAGRVLLIVNACSSGQLLARLDREAVAPEMPMEPARGAMLPDQAADELLATGAGRAVITASKADQRSYFQPRDTHSYFGQALLDAFGGSAASASGGYIGLYELYEGVYTQVRAVTQRRVREAQEPVLTVVQNVGPFPVARYPGATSSASAAISQRRPDELPVRVVPQTVVQAIGQGATAINAAEGSRVQVNNSPLISFGSNSSFGNVSIGDVAGGDIIKTTVNAGGPAERAIDPLRELPRLRERVAAARNVDEDARDEAASKLELAHKALSRGDAVKAQQRIDEALALLRPMNNGYIDSIVRKIEAVRDAL